MGGISALLLLGRKDNGIFVPFLHLQKAKPIWWNYFRLSVIVHSVEISPPVGVGVGLQPKICIHCVLDHCNIWWTLQVAVTQGEYMKLFKTESDCWFICSDQQQLYKISGSVFQACQPWGCQGLNLLPGICKAYAISLSCGQIGLPLL